MRAWHGFRTTISWASERHANAYAVGTSQAATPGPSRPVGRDRMPGSGYRSDTAGRSNGRSALAAARQVGPRAAKQQCWNHKMVNVLDRPPHGLAV